MLRLEQVYIYTPMRSHGISQYSFLVYLLGLHNRITVTFWTSLLLANLSAYYALVLVFCPSGYDFAIPFSRPHLTMITLGVASWLVSNYLPVDFHHRALTCLSYEQNRHRSDGESHQTLFERFIFQTQTTLSYSILKLGSVVFTSIPKKQIRMNRLVFSYLHSSTLKEHDDITPTHQTEIPEK